MSDSAVDLLSVGKHLVTLGQEHPRSIAWHEVENTAQALANGLRVRDGPVDYHTPLGRTSLPQILAALIAAALEGSSIPTLLRIPPLFELLRVSANLCIDHDENRGLLLEAGIPQAVVSLLEGYAETIPEEKTSQPLPLTIPHLKVVRTAIGVLLNVSLNYDPVKSRLRSLEAGMTILKLAHAIYPPAAWLSAKPVNDEEISLGDQEVSWSLRSGVSSWAWKTVIDLKETKDESLQILNHDVLSLLTPVLASFCAPHTQASSVFDPHSEMFETLLETDFDVLEESCVLIESLSLDIEDVRLSLGRGFVFHSEHGGVPCLSTILDFIEFGDYPPIWQQAFPEADRKKRERVFDNCKAALIKVVVEVTGEERNEDVLWGESAEQPGGEFVCRMVSWLKRYVADMDQRTGRTPDPATPFGHRDDIAICASLSLGNLARREKNSLILLSPPHSLAHVLTSRHLLSSSTDIKVKHGVIGLLRHLAVSCAQSPAIQDALANAHVIEHVSRSGVWDEKIDEMSDVVQVSAIGIVKHMCNANVENTFALALPGEDVSQPTGLSLIMALVKRTRSIPVKSEGTRVLVNVIKSLWSNDPSATPVEAAATAALQGIDTPAAIQANQRKRHESMQAVLSSDNAYALASLITRSAKYPLLVNEGIVALSLMSTVASGAPLALTAIFTLDIQPPPEIPSASSSELTSGSDLSSPVVATPTGRGRIPSPRNALDMLIAVLRNVDNPVNFPAEVRVNVCSLFAQITKNAAGPELDRVKTLVRPVIEQVSETLPRDGILTKSMKRLSDLWA
ncbi:unnamed protein product [Mycena citricolor]|nr:unnamed protein product [Mycena citricolor]